MKNHSIGTRLGFCFGFVIALVIGVGIFSIGVVDQAREGLATVNEVNAVKQRYAINFRGSVHDRAIAVRDVVLAQDDAGERNAQIALINDLADFYAESEVLLAAMLSDAVTSTTDEVAIYRHIEDIQNRTNPVVDNIVSLANAGQLDEAHDVLMEQASPSFTEWLGAINEFINLQEDRSKQSGELVNSTLDGYASLVTWALVGLAGTAIIAGLIVSLSITRPLTALRLSLPDLATGDGDLAPELVSRRDEIGQFARASIEMQDRIQSNMRAESAAREAASEQARAAMAQMSDALERLSAGDLQFRISNSFPEAYEPLRTDYNNLISRLSDTLSAVLRASQDVHAGATVISQASKDLSDRTENQAATLEETVAALDEVTQSVTSAASGAQDVALTTDTTCRHAEASGEVTAKAVRSMQEIAESSHEISDIIGVIDDIAFQTNLLALNAGVEAARAGDAGRGFAVVASEVRALAQRSSDAARDIKGLITKSAEQVEKGVSDVGKTGKALTEIVSQVKHIAALVNDIASATQKQSASLTEISSGVTELDGVTQRNAAMVEQVTASAHDLTTNATSLRDLTAFFQVSPRAKTDRASAQTAA